MNLAAACPVAPAPGSLWEFPVHWRVLRIRVSAAVPLHGPLPL